MYEETLKAGLAALDLELDSQQYSQLARYIAEIERFNPVYKLVGASGRDLVIRHILDSLSAAKTIESLLSQSTERRLVDLGSGAGLPGIPLAIALDRSTVTLVERMQRRVGFLRSAIVTSGLSERVTIVDRDLVELDGCFDVVTFRAFRPLVEILDLVSPIVADGGWVCAYKGQRLQLEEELAAVRDQCTSQWSATIIGLEVPFLDAERTLCLLQKI